MSEWQPIETAPRDGTRVLVYTVWEGDGLTPAFNMVQTGSRNRDEDEGWWWLDAIGTPTHWMPLPAPPEPTP